MQATTGAAALREDGRRADELRPVRIEPNYLEFAEGSVLITLGRTRVICAATLEDRVPAWMKGRGTGWVTAEYSMLPRATQERTPRESVKGRPGGRTHEIQRLIGRSLRAITDLRALGERTLWVDCDVVQADGGTRTAAITGAYVALALALHKHFPQGAWPLRNQLAATSVGIVDEQLMLDLAYAEDSRAAVDMNVVMTDGGELVEIQGTAEARPFSRSRLQDMLDLAARGVARLFTIQSEAIAAGRADSGA
jgi:ribonuclease PH